MDINLFKNGTVWLRADFHLHTRKDCEFNYVQSEEAKKNGYPEENTFVNDYVSKLKSENVNIGVITNHNKFDIGEFSALHKKALKENILLLPGVELSVNDGANGVHTLVVFSDEWISNGKDYINAFLNVAFQGHEPKEYENKNARTAKNLYEIVEDLNTYNKDYFIIFAHVEQNNGLWKEFDGGKIQDLNRKEYSELRKHALGFQKVRTPDTKNKVINWLKTWYPAEVEGSDCKTIDEIGSKNGESWLKIGELSFSAVKNALVFYEERVRNSKPENYKHSYIKSVSFNGGILSGKEIDFSPELNTFIGIRGSGKSSVLEVLRFGLNLKIPNDTIDINYKKNLVRNVLGAGAEINIKAVDKFGQEYFVRRIGESLPAVYVNNILQPGISIDQTVIRNPIYFGQKELAASSENFGTDLVEKLVGNKLSEIRQSIKQQEKTIQALVSNLDKFSDADVMIREYEKKREDIKYNLKIFADKGIEEKLKFQTGFDKDSNWFDSTENIIADVENFLENAIEGAVTKINERKDYDSDFNKDEINSAKKSLDKISSILNDLKACLNRIYIEHKDFGSIHSNFEEKKTANEEDFAKIRRELESQLRKESENILDIASFKELNIKLTQTEEMLDALKNQKKDAVLKKNELLKELEKLNELHYKEYSLVASELAKINSDETSLKIKCNFKGDKQSFLKMMKGEFTGSRIKESTYQELVEHYQDFADLYKDSKEEWKNIIPENSLQTFKDMFRKTYAQLLTYRVPDKVSIEYQGKDLRQHSLGQRASALVLFILSRKDNDVIIVDQPEDDLDNQTIYNDVIKLIRKVKTDVQCIFATHNANIPVLGDAEMVHACSFEENSINIQSGNIDMAETQSQIVNIMEGGKEAFDRRKEIYSSWKL